MRQKTLREFEERDDIIGNIAKIGCFMCPSLKDLKKHAGLTEDEEDDIHGLVLLRMEEIAKDLGLDQSPAVDGDDATVHLCVCVGLFQDYTLSNMLCSEEGGCGFPKILQT